MLSSNINLNIRSETSGYNNEVLVSDNEISLGKNDMVSTSVPEKLSHKTPTFQKHAHKEVPSKTPQPSLTKEKIALVLVLTSAF